jgi:hypothetical protein
MTNGAKSRPLPSTSESTGEHLDETKRRLFASDLSGLHLVALVSTPPNGTMIDRAVHRQNPN